MEDKAEPAAAWVAFRSALLEGLKHVPAWAVLTEIIVILCFFVRVEYMLVASTVVLVGAILKAGRFTEKYNRLNKRSEHE